MKCPPVRPMIRPMYWLEIELTDSLRMGKQENKYVRALISATSNFFPAFTCEVLCIQLCSRNLPAGDAWALVADNKGGPNRRPMTAVQLHLELQSMLPMWSWRPWSLPSPMLALHSSPVIESAPVANAMLMAPSQG